MVLEPAAKSQDSQAFSPVSGERPQSKHQGAARVTRHWPQARRPDPDSAVEPQCDLKHVALLGPVASETPWRQ